MVVLEDEANCVQPEISQLVIVQSPDIDPFDCHLAGVGTQDAGNHAEHRGLATARGADYEEHLAKVNDKFDIIHGGHLGIAFTKPFCQISSDDRLIISFYAFAGHFASHFVVVMTSPLVKDNRLQNTLRRGSGKNC